MAAVETSPRIPPVTELSVVVPVFRSETTLPLLYDRVSKALDQQGISFELILVDDCGGDNSWQVIRTLCAADPRVKGILLNRNFGQHAATICGIAQSTGQWVATIDDDLEQPPESLPLLYAAARLGHDIAYGVYPQRSHSMWRNATSWAGRRLFKAAIPSLNDVYTSFRMIQGPIARQLSSFDSPFPFVDGYLSWLTNRVTTVEVQHQNRHAGRSNYSIRKLLVHMFNIFVTFSDAPLKLASWIGIACFGLSVLMIAYVIYGRVTGNIDVSGFASIMAALSFFGGIQLLVLGVFGEYLGRMNFKSSRKPLFIVRETIEREGKA